MRGIFFSPEAILRLVGMFCEALSRNNVFEPWIIILKIDTRYGHPPSGALYIFITGAHCLACVHVSSQKTWFLQAEFVYIFWRTCTRMTCRTHQRMEIHVNCRRTRYFGYNLSWKAIVPPYFGRAFFSVMQSLSHTYVSSCHATYTICSFMGTVWDHFVGAKFVICWDFQNETPATCSFIHAKILDNRMCNQCLGEYYLYFLFGDLVSLEKYGTIWR